MMSSADDQGQEKQVDEPENRLVAWISLMVFSAIAIGAHISWDAYDIDSADKYVTACTCISMILGFLAVVAHMVANEAFVGKKSESAVAALAMIFWIAGLPVIMNPNNAIAVGKAAVDDTYVFTILNANLYFMAWGAFLSIVYIIGHHAKDYGHDLSKITLKTQTWLLFSVISIVVMASSTKYKKEFCNDGENTFDCKRTVLGVWLGCVGFVIGLGMSYATRIVGGTLLELGVSAVMFISYCFGVGYITFGGGPGTFIGNLYLFTWGGFCITMNLTMTLAKEVLGLRAMSFNAEDDSTVPPPPTLEDIDGNTNA